MQQSHTQYQSDQHIHNIATPAADQSGSPQGLDRKSQPWSVRTIALMAVMVALSIVASYIAIPIFPAAPYLKYDPSGVMVILSGLILGPHAAVVVSILSMITHLFTNPLGALIAIAINLALSVLPAVVYARSRKYAHLLLALVAAVVLTLIVAIVGNLIITPLYAHISMAQVAQMIVPILLPFNLLKCAIHAVLTLVSFKSVTMMFKSEGAQLVTAGASA